MSAAVKKYAQIKLEGKSPQESMVAVADAVNFMAKLVDDPVLYTQKISFREGCVYIEWERAPDELHADLIRIYKNGQPTEPV